MFSIIIQSDQDNGVVKNNTIPWILSNDDKITKIPIKIDKITSNNVIIMDESSWDDVKNGAFYLNLTNKIFIIVDESLIENLFIIDNIEIKYDELDNNFSYTQNKSKIVRVSNVLKFLDHKYVKKTLFKLKKFILGKNILLEKFINLKLVKEVYDINIHKSYNCDVKHDFTSKIKSYSLQSHEIINDTPLTILSIYSVQNHEETSCIKIFENILAKHKTQKQLKYFCSDFRDVYFNLRNNKFPLFTANHTSIRQTFIELKWFLLGCTDVNWLKEKGVSIVDNGYSEMVDAQKKLLNIKDDDGPASESKTKAFSDAGPTHGYQLRHFMYPYKDYLTDYNGKGIDQLTKLIKNLKNGSNHETLILLNPYCVFDFNVSSSSKKEISLKHIQETCHATNVISKVSQSALLLYMIAKICNMEVGDFIWSPSSLTIKQDEIEMLETMISRYPNPFPIIEIAMPFEENILNYTPDDVKMYCYDSYPSIVKTEKYLIEKVLGINLFQPSQSYSPSPPPIISTPPLQQPPPPPQPSIKRNKKPFN
jgi:thymidylate synthase/dihydrofolate reductase